MNQSEFAKEFIRLHHAFGRKNPDQAIQSQWFESLKSYGLQDMQKAVDYFRDKAEDGEFPNSPGVVRSRIATLNAGEQGKGLASCRHCLGGRISYERERDGHPYERYAACDCASGDVIAERILRVWEGPGPKNKLCVRYSWLWSKYGSIDTARGGRGMQVTKPAQHSDDPPKGSMGGMDNGLSRLIVKTYAGIHDLSYKDAHRILKQKVDAYYGTSGTNAILNRVASIKHEPREPGEDEEAPVGEKLNQEAIPF